MQVNLASAPSSGLRWRIGLVLVLVGTWIMGLNYARIMPFGAGHEHATAVEASHLAYVRGLVKGTGLPVVTGQLGDAAVQPPVYYVLTTVYSKVIGLRKAVHDPDLDIKLRSVGVIFGVLTVWGIFRVAFLLTQDMVLSVLAAGSVGLTPMFCATAATISNQMAGAFFATMALANLVRPPGDKKTLVKAGLWTAIAFATHPMGVSLVVPWLVLLFWKNADRRNVAIGFAVALVCCIPTVLRNLHVTGSPLGFVSPTLSSFDMVDFVQLSLKSLIGVFASRQIFLSNYIYAPFLALTLGAACLGAFTLQSTLIRRARTATVFAVGAGLIYVLFNLTHCDPDASQLLVAAGTGGMLCAAGWKTLLPDERTFRFFTVAFLLALVLLNAYVFHLLPTRFAAVAFNGSYIS